MSPYETLRYQVLEPDSDKDLSDTDIEYRKAAQYRMIEDSVKALARELIKADLIECEQEYDYVRQATIHSFSVHVLKPRPND